MGLCFVCGALRSGTTLLRLMLDHHPKISNPGEVDFLFDYWDPRGEGGGSNLDVERLLNDRIFQSYDLALPSADSDLEILQSLAAQMSTNKPWLTLNTHRHFEKIPVVFPGAKYIHLLRDPRAVAVSSIGMGWAGNAYYGVDHWIDSERSFGRLREIVSADLIEEIRYDDLVIDAPGNLRRLCGFLNVDYDERMLQYPEDSTYGLPNARSLERWKDVVPTRQLEVLEGKLGAMLDSSGYAHMAAKVRKPNPAERVLLSLDNRYKRIRFNVRRYGAFLTISEQLTRWLRLKTLNGLIRRKIDRIIVAHLR
ncbi:MAG TPA: sulfotransferase [Alphaproteobacteria bacterium]|nr:sulfotransferase [Alphaproteobacteria bacterium]